MLVVLVWIIALVLAIPTYGISIVVAIFINIALAKVANSALTTTSVLTNENIPIDVKIQQLYLNYCQTVHHKTFYSWQYNLYLLLEALGYAMKRLDGDQILSFDVVYAYQKSKGLNSGDRIDYDFLDFIILDIDSILPALFCLSPEEIIKKEKALKKELFSLLERYFSHFAPKCDFFIKTKLFVGTSFLCELVDSANIKIVFC